MNRRVRARSSDRARYRYGVGECSCESPCARRLRSWEFRTAAGTMIKPTKTKLAAAPKAQSSGALSVTARIPRTSAMNVRLAVLQDPLPRAGTSERWRRRGVGLLAAGREGGRDQVGI